MVPKHTNQIREKQGDYDPEIAYTFYEQFATRQDAIEFIMARALKRIYQAEQEVDCAKRAHRNLVKKYINPTLMPARAASTEKSP